jgi:hypothetical protein
MTDELIFTVVREISRHPGAAVAEGLFQGRRAAIKTFDSPEGFRRESGALSAMARAGAPVPHLLWAGPYRDSYVLIQSWVDGTQGMVAWRAAQGEDQAQLVELAAAAHARMCKAALAAPALEVDFMRGLGGVPAGAWPELLTAQVCKWLSRIGPETLEAMGGNEHMSRLLGAAGAAPADLRTIVHCDYLFRNLIISSPASATIIDFGTALIGDPRYDLAKILWCDLDGPEGELSNRFVRSWTERTGLSAAPELLGLYVCCHSLAAVAWVEKQASPTHADRNFRKLALQTFARTPKPWL